MEKARETCDRFWFDEKPLPDEGGLLESDVATLPPSPTDSLVTLWEHGSGNRIKGGSLGQNGRPALRYGTCHTDILTQGAPRAAHPPLISRPNVAF